MITSVVVKDHGAPGSLSLAEAPHQGSFAMVRFAAQATSTEITNFLGAYKATVVEAPMRSQPPGAFRIRISESKLDSDEVNKLLREMQADSKIVSFIAPASPPTQ